MRQDANSYPNAAVEALSLFERVHEALARCEFQFTHHDHIACHSVGPIERDVGRPHSVSATSGASASIYGFLRGANSIINCRFMRLVETNFDVLLLVEAVPNISRVSQRFRRELVGLLPSCRDKIIHRVDAIGVGDQPLAFELIFDARR